MFFIHKGKVYEIQNYIFSTVIKEWNWTLANGKSPASEEKLIRLDFCMGGSSQEDSVSKCQQQASMLCE